MLLGCCWCNLLSVSITLSDQVLLCVHSINDTWVRQTSLQRYSSHTIHLNSHEGFLTILWSGRCPQRWNRPGRRPQTPACSQTGSAPVRRAYCHSRTSSQRPPRPSWAGPSHSETGWSDCQCCRTHTSTQVKLSRNTAAHRFEGRVCLCLTSPCEDQIL